MAAYTNMSAPRRKAPETTSPTPRTRKAPTPFLDSFGQDLTHLAANDQLDSIVGREKEIERVAQILSRRKKNNAILVGEPGVGKTAIAEGLALRITQRKVPQIIQNKRLIALDMAALVAGTKYRGQFEERMKGLMEEIQKSPHILLFIDELHTIVGAGGAVGALDAANILKPALARGTLQCIGATTHSEYRQYIEKDGAFARRFQVVKVAPTTTDQTITILNNIKNKYEDHHSVSYTPEAIRACAMLSDRYIAQRLLPDKAIDVLDEAGASISLQHLDVPPHITHLEEAIEETKLEKNKFVKIQQYEEAAQLRDQEQKLGEKLAYERAEWEKNTAQHRQPITERHVADIIAKITHIPAQRIAHDRLEELLTLQEDLQQKIIGQDQAIEKIAKTIQRTHIGLHDPQKPLGSFIFLGPTGVGKTALAKTLATTLFGHEKALIRIDMSEYMEKIAVSRLVGAPPGYVGYEEGGQLTEKIRQNPYSVILLDEIEKAHPEVHNLLLQMMDDGVLTDGLGRSIDCKNTIIIMTSNVGARELQAPDMGFTTQIQKAADPNAAIKAKVNRALQKTFRPEFINRLDDVIIFNPLDKEHLHQIVDLHLQQLHHRATTLGYQLEITPSAKNFLSTQGYDPQYGVRPLKRAIQQHLADTLTAQVLTGTIQHSSTIRVTHKKGDNTLTLKAKSRKNLVHTIPLHQEPLTQLHKS